jgi:hypothetical protein
VRGLTTPKNAHLWLPGLLRDRWSRWAERLPTTAWVTLADHFEPLGGGASIETATQRVARWRKEWPEIARRHEDDTGRPPSYAFFYPQEEYRPELLDPLAEMMRLGIADVEIHIHHDGDGEQSFVDRMQGFIHALREVHGLLRMHDGRPVFGFIHGNWALDNARPDGLWCGLNNEITLLRDLGCYADFTLPAAPSPCQTGPVNTVYRVQDDPRRPRSHSRGRTVQPGSPAWGDLTLITGPLGLSRSGRPPWRPRLETGEIAGYALPTLARVRSWLRLAPRIGGHAFVKLYGHGAQDRNAGPLLSGGLDRLFAALSGECRAADIALRYVSPWEMWKVVESLRKGEGTPGRAAN